jgi:hypothetical protein
VPALAFVLLTCLPACPSSTSGDGLCAYTRATAICGISEAECQDLLAADPAIDAEGTSDVDVDVDVDVDGVLSANAFGRAVGMPWDPPAQDLTIDLGPVRERGSAFDPDGDGLDFIEEAAAGTAIDDNDSDDDGFSDGNEVDCGADPIDSASQCP